MHKLALITGAGSGIGRALTLSLVKRDITVVVVGRRIAPLQALQALAPEQVFTLALDVSDEKGRDQIVAFLESHGELHYLVHNAATIEPIGSLSTMDLAAWRQMQAVNIEAPIALTQGCLPYLSQGSRILQISSEAAHSPFANIAPYCLSKAANYMAYQLWRQELMPKGVSVGSVKPGIVDTAMTDLMVADVWRETFPAVNHLFEMKRKAKMLPVETVAAFLTWLLCDVEAKTYCEAEWDIYERRHHLHWLGDLPMPIPVEIDNAVNG